MAVPALPSQNKLDFVRLGLFLAFLAVGWAFWTSPALWPLKILVVMIHETGHALAALLVGGSVDKVVLSANESGECLSRLPDGFFAKVLVYSAGYVGSALAGAVLVYASVRFRLGRWMLAGLATWLVVMAILYAGSLFTFAFCGGTAAVLVLLARYGPTAGVDLVNVFLAAFSSLYAVMDLKDDLWTPVRAHSDAALLANLTLFPAVFWAFVWTVASLVILGYVGQKAFLRPPQATSLPASLP